MEQRRDHHASAQVRTHWKAWPVCQGGAFLSHRHITDELKLGDQVWFHHSNYVNDVAQVATVFRNAGFDEARGADQRITDAIDFHAQAERDY